MPAAATTDIEQRLKAVLSDPDNSTCSECDRTEYKPIWAAFLTCPVDQKLLGVVCCKKCYKLFNKVKDEEFTMKSLTELDDWTGEYMEALELGGNKLVNTCYEATVTKERDNREKKKYGYEAFHFEKYVNLTYFDEILYKQLISQASKALVEKRFSKSLRGFNLKKMEQEDQQPTSDEDESYDNEGYSDDEGEACHHNAGDLTPAEIAAMAYGGGGSGGGRRGMQRAQSARGIRDRRQQAAATRKRQSARNLLLDEKKHDDGGPPSRPSLSRRGLGSIRREVLDDDRSTPSGRAPTNVKDISDGNPAPPAEGGRLRRRLSARRLDLGGGTDDNNERGGMRRSSSNPRLSGEGGMRRSGSNRRLAPERNGSGRMVRSGSSTKLNSAAEDSGASSRGSLRNGRHRLSARNIYAAS